MTQGMVCWVCKRVYQESTKKVRVPKRSVLYRTIKPLVPPSGSVKVNVGTKGGTPKIMRIYAPDARGEIYVEERTNNGYIIDFCSDACWQWMRERKKVARRILGVPSFRKGIIGRAGGRCEKCGSKKRLDIHHRTEIYNGGSDDPKNLIVLCQNCHSKAPLVFDMREGSGDW